MGFFILPSTFFFYSKGKIILKNKQKVSLDFDWISEQQKQYFIQTGQFKVENCALTGIKLSKQKEIYGKKKTEKKKIDEQRKGIIREFFNRIKTFISFLFIFSY